jgi:hypothetical protein
MARDEDLGLSTTHIADICFSLLLKPYEALQSSSIVLVATPVISSVGSATDGSSGGERDQAVIG